MAAPLPCDAGMQHADSAAGPCLGPALSLAGAGTPEAWRGGGGRHLLLDHVAVVHAGEIGGADVAARQGGELVVPVHQLRGRGTGGEGEGPCLWPCQPGAVQLLRRRPGRWQAGAALAGPGLWEPPLRQPPAHLAPLLGTGLHPVLGHGRALWACVLGLLRRRRSRGAGQCTHGLDAPRPQGSVNGAPPIGAHSP